MKRRLALLLAVVLWAGIQPAYRPIAPPSFTATVSAQSVVRRPIVSSAACSVFPCNAVLDNFNRANAGTLGSAWTVGTRPSWNVDITIVSNKAVGGSINSDYWNATTFTNPEVYVTVSGSMSQMVLWNMANLNSSSFTGYELLIAGPSTLQVYRWDNSSTATQLDTNITQTMTTGDSIGVWHNSGAIKVYWCAAGGACGVSGAGWTLIRTISPSDNTYTSGYIGIKDGDNFDDFGGGSR